MQFALDLAQAEFGQRMIRVGLIIVSGAAGWGDACLYASVGLYRKKKRCPGGHQPGLRRVGRPFARLCPKLGNCCEMQQIHSTSVLVLHLSTQTLSSPTKVGNHI